MKLHLSPWRGRAKREWRGWTLMMVLLVLISLALLGFSLLNPARWDQLGNLQLPISMHSRLLADYSIDPYGTRIPEVAFNLIDQVLRDQPTPAPSERYATVVNNLLTLVPTITPFPTGGLPTRIQQGNTLVFTPTLMGISPTASLTMVVTPTPLSWTPTQITFASTSTPIRPTSTRPPQNTATPRPTVPPTAVPTQQPTTQPTDIPYPPPPPDSTLPPPYPLTVGR